MRKKRTSVKRSTLNPIYNEALTFDVPSTNIEEVSLIVKVIDYDRYVVILLVLYLKFNDVPFKFQVY